MRSTPSPVVDRVWAPRALTEAELHAEAAAVYGPEVRNWAFVCPSCLTVATLADFTRLGADAGALGRECIGRYGAVGCRYAAYGLVKGPWELERPGVAGDGCGQVVNVFPLATVLEGASGDGAVSRSG